MGMENPVTESERRAVIVGGVVDVSLGTMWRVREWRWKQVIPRELDYDLDSKAFEHPGISIFDQPPPYSWFIPMLHGRSMGTSRSVWVSGFSRDDPQRLTAFGHLFRPAEGLGPRLWIGDFPVDGPTLKKEWIRLFGGDGPPSADQRRPVAVNPGKRIATPEECVQLRQFVAERMKSPNDE